ncbi:hypothetical protein PU683_03230 [Kosakonia cowanii]|uniref:hypothetical protein n=1 Tax=Kosakonia cowanii TaxID=208223 RepID=UPI0023F8FF7F|nr:hypothetical protein [Kosakonia cowanii]MDF7758547.1 hypothetical protein [Kosakonia cowanii]
MRLFSKKKSATTLSPTSTDNEQTNDNSPVKQGDLIYGVHSELGRRWYAEHKEPFKSRTLTIDELKILKSDPFTNQRYAQFEQEFRNFLKSSPKYKSALDSAGNNEDIRRKAKAGLQWAVNSGRNVHFVLDDLNISNVINKQHKGKNADTPASNGKKKNRAITGAELRWIYRNRMNENVKSHIFFWLEGKVVLAPWEDDIVQSIIQNGQIKEIFNDRKKWSEYK